MKWRQFTEDYLSFSKKERKAILAVLGFILLIYLLPKLFPKQKLLVITKDKALLAAIDTLSHKQPQPYKRNQPESEETGSEYEPSIQNNHTAEVFPFDPNTLSREGWIRLGLRERTINTIENYRNKGGRFYKPEDLKKIWGLPDVFYTRVKDYIAITTTINLQQEKPIVPAYTKPEKKTWNIDLNNTDTTALVALPGIGSKLALRILNFRDKLGGFYSVDQVAETYGLQDSVFQKVKSYLHVNSEVRKLNVNTASKDELKMHPYIKWNLANAIVEYRNQHGNFKSLDDLKNIAMVDANLFSKITHYLSLD